LSLALVPILVALVAAPVLAWAAYRGGTVARWVTRGVLALPLAAYAPAALVLAQRTALSPQQRGSDLPGLVRSLYWWGTFGLVAALATTLFLAAMRQPDRRRAGPAMAVAAGVALAAVLAAALQEFTYPYLAVGADQRTATPLVMMFLAGSQMLEIGAAAAVATLLLAVLCLLGLAVTLVIVLSGLRLEVGDPDRAAVRPVPAAVAGVVLLVVVVLSVIGLVPLLGKVFGGDGQTAPRIGPLPVSTATIEVNTWVPTFLGTLIGVGAAVAAAVGIGWLRPFGRRSMWLLLPFGLFLFVGLGPLALHGWEATRAAGRLDSLSGLIPPAWIAVPALFVLTLLLRGQAERVDAARRRGQPPAVARHVLWALPMVAVVFLATWVVRAQEVLWPLIVAHREQHSTAPVVLAEAVFRGEYAGGGGAPYSLVLPAGLFVLLFLMVIAVQLLYLDRIAVRVGRTGPEN
jgi:hypothetical protein